MPDTSINNPGLDKTERLAALEAYETASGRGVYDFDRSIIEINNHIHTIYSFSPYTPSMAAFKAKDAGLGAAGSVDHDSIGASEEMIAACKILGIGGCSGFEVRASFKTKADGKPGPYAGIKINNPDSEGLVYMTVQGIPNRYIQKTSDFLAPIRAERIKRTKAMTISANSILRETGLNEIDFESDIIEKSKYKEGGGITERHLLAAMAEKIIKNYGKGPALCEGLKQKMGVNISPKIVPMLSDPANPHYLYDLLGILKAELLPLIFIQPDENECIPAREVTAFAASISAISGYAYLGDVGESPTGDKKAEKFEDDFIEDLFAELSCLGYKAIAYMPPRNTAEQMRNIRRLSAEWGFMEISGVDINSSRQSFNCPEVLHKDSRHLLDTTWALIAHERLASIDDSYGLFSYNNPVASMELARRLALYADFGKRLDLYNPEESAVQIASEIDKGNCV